MVHENALLAALLFSRTAYESVVEYTDPTDMSAHGAALFEEIVDYYQRDPDATACDKTLIRDRIHRKLPKHKDTFTNMLLEMTPELGTHNIVREVLELRRRSAGEDLIMAITQAKNPSDVAEVLSTYTALNDATELVDAGGGIKLLTKSLSELVQESADTSKCIKLLPKRFNAALRGGALPGHTIVIFGRVNVGKSALAINNIAGFLRQGKTVLLVENEDLADDVKRRIGCRLVGCSLDWAEAHPDEFGKRGKERGIDLLMIPDPPPGNVRDIDRLAQALDPDVIVVNQLRHLAPDSKDAVGAVDRVSQRLREIGKQRRILMVLVGAAKEGEVGRDGLAMEKAVLEKSDSYGSRTGVPGIADIMFGIGDNQSLKERGMVAIHLCKNKRGSAEPVLYQKVNLENCRFTDA
jgi:hypothetical protein